MIVLMIKPAKIISVELRNGRKSSVCSSTFREKCIREKCDCDPLHASMSAPLHTYPILSGEDTVLSETEWMKLSESHTGRIDLWMNVHLKRRSENERDPIADFLFEYYNFRPGKLRRWTPGWNTVLEGSNAEAFLSQSQFERTDKGIKLSAASFPSRLVRSTTWIRDLLVATQNRTPHFGCYGMHEWAMVYGSEAVRHANTSLRMSRNEINRVVEESSLTCTHFDAYRFFTDDAKPLNATLLRREDMITNDQPACLHANMDIYRWAIKRYRWIPAIILAESFFLAYRIREVDMRASPYDVSSAGLEPIRVETPEGREQYQKYQRAFFYEARMLRDSLIDAYNEILVHVTEPTSLVP